MSLGSESPRRTLLRTVFTLTGKAIDESKLIDREPRDTSARGAYDILVLGETVLLPTQPLGRRSRPNRGRASSAAGVIAQATQGCRRLVAYPPVSVQASGGLRLRFRGCITDINKQGQSYGCAEIRFWICAGLRLGLQCWG